MRDIPVGNGDLLVNFDEFYQIRDFYFPRVGQENHSDGFPFRLGVWVDGDFSWVFSGEWERSLKYLPDTLVTDVLLVNKRLGIEMSCNDTVAARENIFLRRVVVKNLGDEPRDVRVFLHHDFRIYENKTGDTAFYDPDTLSLIHYKRHRYFLINTLPHFDEVATGRKAFRNSEGTWRDAENGELHGGTITEGSVDSTVGLHALIEDGGSFEFYYWIAAGTNHTEVCELNEHVLKTGPADYLSETAAHWRSTLDTADGIDLTAFSANITDLYKRSLLIIRTQIDNGGAIIAANDHDVTDRATDHYSYLWPRDGAFVANALDIAGHTATSKRFFELCGRIVHKRGYFLQKYNPDGSVGSGWHAYWDKYGKHPLVPIQEDETALVLWALWEHYEKTNDLELVRSLYDRLVIRCADFMIHFRDPATVLPMPSWNLWEDRRGVHTFTCATVVAGLRAAANFAGLFEDEEKAKTYSAAADEMVAAMREHLYSAKIGRFLRSMQSNGGDSLTPDATVDASMFAVFYFGCFEVDDPVVIGTMQAIEDHLTNETAYGGVARFNEDGYMRTSTTVTGNSWFICTLWLAEYYIARAKTPEDLKPALEILEWTTERALPSGVLAEQVDPLTGEPASVSPLTWSHSTFVATVHSYLEKYQSLKADE